MNQSLKKFLRRAVILVNILSIMTIIHPTLSARVQRKYKHEAKIKATYDAASDKTTLAMWGYDVRTNNDDKTETIAIAAGVTFPGKSLDSTPRFVEFGVLSQSRF